MSKQAYRWILLVVLLATTGITAHLALSGRALETHEIFVAQTTREMIASGDYVVPTFGDQPRLQKPPLMYWATAAVARITGRPDVPEWTPRIVSALAAVALVALTAFLGTTIYERRTGLLAAAMLAFSYGLFSYAGNARPEMLYAACTALSTLAFVKAWRKRAGNARRPWALLAWIAFALALLAKGPQLPVLIFAGISIRAVRVGGWRLWYRAFRPISGSIVAALIILPWPIAVAARVDNAGRTWLTELVGLRFGGADTGARVGGFIAWILDVLTPEYLLYCASMLLPWGILIPVAFFVPFERRAELARGRILFFAMIVPLIALSLASHTRDYYILPILPVLAVLLARGTVDLLQKAERHATTRNLAAAAGWTIAALAFAGAIVTVAEAGMNRFDAGAITAIFILTIALVIPITRKVGGAQPALPTAVVAALAATAAMLAVIGAEPALWRSRHQNLDRIATNLARIAGDDLPVLTRGIDPDDMIYRLNRPLTPLPADAAPNDALRLAPAVIVATPDFIAELEQAGADITRHQEFPIEHDERAAIATITTAPDSIAPR